MYRHHVHEPLHRWVVWQPEQSIWVPLRRTVDMIDDGYSVPAERNNFGSHCMGFVILRRTLEVGEIANYGCLQVRQSETSRDTRRK
jgi:hypothetical protein